MSIQTFQSTQNQVLPEEVWVQNKTNEGKFYYYNARTRESSWSKPEGPNTKILRQEEVEQMAVLKNQQNNESEKVRLKY